MPKLVPMSFFHNPAPILNTNGFHSFKSYSNQLRTYRMFFETFVPAQVHGQVVETFETLNNLTYPFYDKKFGIKEFCRVWLLQCLCPLNIQSNRSLGQSEDSAIFPLILLVHVLAYVVSPNYSPSLTRHLAGQRVDLFPQLLQNWAPAITIWISCFGVHAKINSDSRKQVSIRMAASISARKLTEILNFFCQRRSLKPNFNW